MSRLVSSMILSVAAAGLVLGCYEDAVFGPRQTQGTTRVFLTDAPLPFSSIDRVEVYVVEVSASTEDDFPADQQMWSRLAQPRRRFDLLQLQQSTLGLLGTVELAPDLYYSVRLTIDCDSSRVIWANGSEASVRWPAEGHLAIPALVEVPIAVPASGASIVVDFDLGQSLVSGLGDPLHDFLFTPVIRAVSATATGAVSGIIRGDADGDGLAEQLPNVELTVYRGEPGSFSDSWSIAATGRTDSLGTYTIGFLVPGAYTVDISTPLFLSLGTLIAHDVEIVAGKEFVLSVTLPATSAIQVPSWR